MATFTYDFFWYSGALQPAVYAAGTAIEVDVYDDPSTPENEVFFTFRNLIDNGYDSASIVNVFIDTGKADNPVDPMFTDLSVWDQSAGGALSEPGDLDYANLTLQEQAFLNFDKIAFTADFSAGRLNDAVPRTAGVNPGEYLTVKGVLGNGYDYFDVITALNVGMNDTYNDALYWNELTNPEKVAYRDGAEEGLRFALLVHTIFPDPQDEGHGLFVTDGTENELVIGGPGDDIIVGGDDDDVLGGGPGRDTLTGGPGVDTFRDSPAGLNGDYITDFEPGEYIIVEGAVFGTAQVRYNVGTGLLSLDTDSNGSFETTVQLPARLVGGFSTTVDGTDTVMRFDPWPFKIWGGAPSDVPITGDFDGAGGDEYGVYRVATAEWFLSGQPPYVWGGGPYDMPVVGDYNGDGRDEFGVYRVNTAEWWLAGQPLYVWGGGPNDVPVVGDFDGDGTDDFGVYRKDTAEWWIVGQPLYVWGGGPNDVPVVGDYNGDGRDDFGVYRSDTAEWWIVGQPKFVWGGGPNDEPVVGDFTGDGRDDFGVYRGDTGEWWIAGQSVQVLGGEGYEAVPADYDGDGTTDPAVYFDGIWASDVLI